MVAMVHYAKWRFSDGWYMCTCYSWNCPLAYTSAVGQGK
jgi:hypothetical protein